MCDDQSPSSCRISSAKSVSSAWMPCSASASLRSISSVVSDLTLTTSSAPWRRATSTTTAFASAASRAQCTCPPAASTAASNSTRYRSRFASTSCLIALPGFAQLLPVGQLRDDARPLRADRLRRVPEVRRGAACSRARRARLPGTRVMSRRGSPRGGSGVSRSDVGKGRRRCAAGTSCRAPCTRPRPSPRSHRTCRRASRSTCRRS